MTRPSVLAALLVSLNAVSSPRAIDAQAVTSAVRGISLVAIKPAVQPVDAVQVHSLPPVKGEGGDPEVRTQIDVREDGPCIVEVEEADRASHAQALVRGADGQMHRLTGAPIQIFRGWCRATAPAHVLSLVGAPDRPDALPESVDLTVRVVAGRGDQLHSWTADVVVPLRPPPR